MTKSKARTIPSRAAALALTLCGLGASAAASAAQTGYVGILGGGPVYKHVPANITELQKSGFNELIVWSVEVNAAGDLNLNGEFPLTSAGTYIGNNTYPTFPADLAKIKSGTVKRITLSIGSSNFGDWEDVKALVDKQGTGPNSILYKDFAAIKAALPIDAIDFDDENSYDFGIHDQVRRHARQTRLPRHDESLHQQQLLDLGRRRHQQENRRPGGRHPPADLCRRRRKLAVLRLELWRCSRPARHFRPDLGAPLPDTHADACPDAKLAHAVRHYRRLGLDF